MKFGVLKGVDKMGNKYYEVSVCEAQSVSLSLDDVIVDVCHVVAGLGPTFRPTSLGGVQGHSQL